MMAIISVQLRSIFAKGCAFGKLGWVKDPIHAFYKELHKGQKAQESDITCKLDIYDLLGLNNQINEKT